LWLTVSYVASTVPAPLVPVGGTSLAAVMLAWKCMVSALADAARRQQAAAMSERAMNMGYPPFIGRSGPIHEVPGYNPRSKRRRGRDAGTRLGPACHAASAIQLP
jgi:hypothetical protein